MLRINLLDEMYSRLNNDPLQSTYIPKTWGYITICGKRDSADLIKLRTLREKDDLGLSRWAQYDHSVLVRQKAI